MPPDFDIAIVGAGLIGLAIGRAAALQGMSVLIAEKHKAIATETSARNSGVIHAGLYYPPGSLKAQLCVAGARQLYTYAHARNIPHNKCGKLIVGGDTKRLEALKAQGTANGVDGLTLIDAAEKEPALKNHTALYSPHSGVIDTHAVAYSLLADFETAGGTLALNTAIQSITPGALITTAQDKVTARHIINAAGLHAHLLARATQ
ncbi:MAG: NAD(P)/FAD-dependent oxidoreductase, partial [Alphaproteobacteria bacterium]